MSSKHTLVKEDLDLVSKAQRGSEAAFEQLYRLHSRQVYHLCFRMTRNRAEAEDLTQETFLQVYRKIGTFRGDAAFSSWLHRVAVNIVLMTFRKRCLDEVSRDEWVNADSDPVGDCELGSCDSRLAGCIDRLALESAVGGLAPGYRAVFLLHDVFGYSYEEIGPILNCTVGTCKSQLHKSRLKLRQYLLAFAGTAGPSRHERSDLLCLDVSSIDQIVRAGLRQEECTHSAG
jgi:RNA polymerase sigma-70 factor (ECF subfamily)